MEKKFLNGRCTLCGGSFGRKGVLLHPVKPESHMAAIRLKFIPGKSDLARKHICRACYKIVQPMSDKSGKLLPEFDPESTPEPKQKAQKVEENFTNSNWTKSENDLRAKEIEDLSKSLNNDPIELEPGFLNKVISRVVDMCPLNFPSFVQNVTPKGRSPNAKAEKNRQVRLNLFAVTQILQQVSAKHQGSILMTIFNETLFHGGFDVSTQHIFSKLRISNTRETIQIDVVEKYRKQLKAMKTRLDYKETRDPCVMFRVIDNLDKWVKRKFHGHDKQSKMIHHITRIVREYAVKPGSLKIREIVDIYRRWLAPPKLPAMRDWFTSLAKHLAKPEVVITPKSSVSDLQDWIMLPQKEGNALESVACKNCFNSLPKGNGAVDITFTTCDQAIFKFFSKEMIEGNSDYFTHILTLAGLHTMVNYGEAVTNTDRFGQKFYRIFACLLQRTRAKRLERDGWKNFQDGINLLIDVWLITSEFFTREYLGGNPTVEKLEEIWACPNQDLKVLLTDLLNLSYFVKFYVAGRTNGKSLFQEAVVFSMTSFGIVGKRNYHCMIAYMLCQWSALTPDVLDINLESTFTKPSPNTCVFSDEWIEIIHFLMSKTDFDKEGKNYHEYIASWFETHKHVKLTKDEIDSYFGVWSNSIGQFKKTRLAPQADLAAGKKWIYSRKSAIGSITTVKLKSTSWLLPETSKVTDHYDNDSHQAFLTGITMGNNKLEDMAKVWNAKILSKVHSIIVPDDPALGELIARLATDLDDDPRPVSESTEDEEDEEGTGARMTFRQLELSLMKEFMTPEEIESEILLFKDPIVVELRVDTSVNRIISDETIDTTRSMSEQLKQLELRAAESIAIDQEMTIGGRLSSKRRGDKRKDEGTRKTPSPKKSKGKKGKVTDK
jgi:5S rRNA maturation endonuclease (ribonuclease M5)